jgi:hypothetical protein
MPVPDSLLFDSIRQQSADLIATGSDRGASDQTGSHPVFDHFRGHRETVDEDLCPVTCETRSQSEYSETTARSSECADGVRKSHSFA